MRAFVGDRIEVIASPLLIAELERVLRRPKFPKYVDEWTDGSSSSGSGVMRRSWTTPLNSRWRRATARTTIWSHSLASKESTPSSAAIATSSTPGFRNRPSGLRGSWRIICSKADRPPSSLPRRSRRPAGSTSSQDPVNSCNSCTRARDGPTGEPATDAPYDAVRVGGYFRTGMLELLSSSAVRVGAVRGESPTSRRPSTRRVPDRPSSSARPLAPADEGVTPVSLTRLGQSRPCTSQNPRP